MLPRVKVLMSAYNGEKYIVQQIDSILNQKDVEISLIIRDDSSTDNTLEVLSNYESSPYIEIIKGKNIGCGNSFMEMLYNCGDADYFALADQDDLWFPEKLIMAIKKIENYSDKPVLYTSNQTITDEFLQIKGLRYQDSPKFELDDIIMGNNLAGCTFVINRKLKELLTSYERRPSPDFLRIRIHDAWICAFSKCVGEVVYDCNSYMLYRQHSNNVVGVRKIRTTEIVRNYLKSSYWEKHYRLLMASELTNKTARLSMQKGTKEILLLFKNTNTYSGRIDFIKKYKKITGKEIGLLLRIKVLMGAL